MLWISSQHSLSINEPLKIGNHKARFSSDGRLQPWLPIGQVLDHEMQWYKDCPNLSGYPAHVVLTFMDGKYHAVFKRKDSIPAMQCGTAILSYLGYGKLKKGKVLWVIDRAKEFARYIMEDANTGSEGSWPQFPRSTGVAGAVPQPPDCGRQADHPFDVEPDKGALFAYSLVKLYEATKDERYREFAVQTARTLVSHMKPGDAAHSPWPFRVDYRTGEGRGDVSADMGYPLALFDSLSELGLTEFKKPKDQLWTWIRDFQLPSLKKGASLWVNFFEDYDLPTNRNSWSATNLAKLLMARKDKLDPNWQVDSKLLIDFVMERFTSVRFGVPVCGEQDDDKDPWGGALSNYAAAVATYAKLTRNSAYENLAHQALLFCTYAIDTDGCPGQSAEYAIRGGWQEDAHTDVVRNIVEALEDFPKWVTAK